MTRCCGERRSYKLVGACRGRAPLRIAANRFLPILAAVALALAVASTAAAQHVPPEIVKVRIGFDNLFKIGHWTPVEVTLKGGSDALTGRVEITVPDCDAVPSRVVTPPSRAVRLVKDQESVSLLYVRFGQSDSSIRIAFRAMF